MREAIVAQVFWQVTICAATDKWYLWLTCFSCSQREDSVRVVELPAWFTASNGSQESEAREGAIREMVWSNAAYQIKLPARSLHNWQEQMNKN